LEAELWLVVGLGNPGDRYRFNRHNIGFMVLDAIAEGGGGYAWAWKSSRRFSAESARGTLEGEKVLLVKPQTYMNLSGEAVGPLARFYGVPSERLIVIHDDVDLEFGRLKVKKGGGAGGHKGLRSLTQHAGGPGYLRVRCGVGRPTHGDTADFVLADFTNEEEEGRTEMVKQASAATHLLLRDGLRKTMNKYNGVGKKSKKDAESDDKKDELK
jgi:peptidyl-tRNA hydrolase, PTH1 family